MQSKIMLIGLVVIAVGIMFLFPQLLGLQVVSWSTEPVIKTDVLYVFVGKKLVYYNDFGTARQMVPRVIITGDYNIDSGKYLSYVVNPGVRYECEVGWIVPYDYTEKHVNVRILFYTADAGSLENEVLEDTVEFSATVPAKPMPNPTPKIVLASYTYEIEGNSLTVYATLKNVGDAKGLAEIYFIVDGNKIPSGNEVYYTEYISPQQTKTYKFGTWLYQGGGIKVHISTKINTWDTGYTYMEEKILDIPVTTQPITPPPSDGQTVPPSGSSAPTEYEEPIVDSLPAGQAFDLRTIGLSSTVIGAALVLAGITKKS
ncbi:MAG: hypothetical protein QXU81_00190 [Candidatus Bathyarchaeia archaeon]